MKKVNSFLLLTLLLFSQMIDTLHGTVHAHPCGSQPDLPHVSLKFTTWESFSNCSVTEFANLLTTSNMSLVDIWLARYSTPKSHHDIMLRPLAVPIAKAWILQKDWSQLLGRCSQGTSTADWEVGYVRREARTSLFSGKFNWSLIPLGKPEKCTTCYTELTS